jgi:hypothetical protein
LHAFFAALHHEMNNAETSKRIRHFIAPDLKSVLDAAGEQLGRVVLK